LIVAYALDLLGTVPGGEIATRGFLWVWLFVGIPAGVFIVVNLILGPAPRRLVERALAERLAVASAMLREPDARTRKTFKHLLQEGTGEIPAWLKLAGAEKTSPARDIAALSQAAQSTIVLLSVVDLLTSGEHPLLPAPLGEHIARTLDAMSAILRKGGYPVDVALASHEDEALLRPLAAAACAELRAALSAFAEPPPPDPQPARPKTGFFLPDAFTNPAHVQYALKTTGAAMFCYVAYLLLDWPGIHTCLITCYIVSLGTAAETIEKQTLRFLGCLLGAASGIAAIVFLMPNVTSIGGLMAIVFVGALVSGWIVAGSPRISYVGFQLAFAFFLCVIQGAAPAFDMTIARDRIVGVLFGNLVVAIVFTLIWPVSVAKRIDPAIAALLARLASLASAASKPQRWALAAEARTKLGAIEQDLDLVHYEPSAIRPPDSWMARRRAIVGAVASLHGPLLIEADLHPAASRGVAQRLDRLAANLGPGSEAAAPAPAPPSSSAADIAASVETPIAKLEQLVAERPERAKEGAADYATA
jgi:multidrug resistance protein MdtO